jgi:hypothetical protein
MGRVLANFSDAGEFLLRTIIHSITVSGNTEVTWHHEAINAVTKASIKAAAN